MRIREYNSTLWVIMLIFALASMLSLGACFPEDDDNGNGGSDDKPGKPVNPSPADCASEVPTILSLSWDACNNTDVYYVYLGTTTIPPFLVVTTDTSVNSAIVGTLTPGTTHYWRVRAGNSFANTSSEIWEFYVQTPILMTWTLKYPPDDPPARWMNGMAWDGTQIILFSGSTYRPNTNLLTPTPETWAWDGDNWTKLSPADEPYSRYGIGMCYDGRGAFMFGGRAIVPPDPYTFPLKNDTWRFNNGNWIELNPINSPPPRRNMSFAWDSTRDVIVMFGGIDNTNTVCNDTWEFDLPTQNWYEVTVTSPPDIRQGTAGCYLDNVTIMYGGSPLTMGGNTQGDMFTWTPLEWTEFLPATPGPLEMAAMAVDMDNGYAVLFGGSTEKSFDNTSTYSNIAWQFNSTQWRQITSTGFDVPGTLVGASMAYDPVRKEFVLFGGFGGGTWSEGFRNNTWTLKE